MVRLRTDNALTYPSYLCTARLLAVIFQLGNRGSHDQVAVQSFGGMTANNGSVGSDNKSKSCMKMHHALGGLGSEEGLTWKRTGPSSTP
jgi:hypothetical protein